MIEILTAGAVIMLFAWFCAPLIFAVIDATDLLSKTASRRLEDIRELAKNILVY